MYKVVRLFPYQEGVQLEQSVLEGIAEVVERPSYTEKEIIENAKDADVIICIYENINRNVIEALTHLKMIAFKSIGFNSVDLAYATEKNIAVSHNTKYCVKEVADYVMSAILLSNRKIIQFNKSVIEDKKWDFTIFPEIQRLEEQVVGFLGFGNIPKLVAERCKPYGCKLIAYDPFVSEEVASKYDVKLVDKEQIFKEADYISCHLPSNKSTENSINKEYFDLIKDSAVFINSSRGNIVQENDLIEALDNGKVSMAILDVVHDENPDVVSNPLINHKNVIATPHIAFYSRQSTRDGRIETATNIKHFLEKNYDKAQIINKVKY